MRLKISVIFVVVGLYIYMCGVPEIRTEPNPPLGVVASYNSNVVTISWWGYNTDPRFTGYAVFISSPNSSSGESEVRSGNRLLMLPNSTETQLTLREGTVTESKLYTLSLTQYIVYIKTNNTIMSDEIFPEGMYYVGVRAYFESTKTYSPFSNITNFDVVR